MVVVEWLRCGLRCGSSVSGSLHREPTNQRRRPLRFPGGVGGVPERTLRSGEASQLFMPLGP